MTSSFRLRKITNLLVWLPALVILILYVAGYLSFNPIQAAQQWTGRIALAFFIFSLAITPLVFITGFQPLAAIRRPLGLAAWYYALIHLLVYVGLDLQFDWQTFFHLLFTQPFLWAGLSGFAILVILGATSMKRWKQNLGKYWNWVHLLAYPGSILVIIHYAMARKGNILTLQGDILWPIILLVLTLILLSFRLRFVQRWFIKLHNQD